MTLRCQVAFPETLSGIGADLFVNTWHIIDLHSPADPVAASADFRSALEDLFYGQLESRFSDLVGAVATFKAYDLTDPEPRAPVNEGVITVTPAGGGVLPPELAVVVSARAVFESGAPKARRRGRTYVGGLNLTALDQPTGQISAAAVGTFAQAATDLLDDSENSVDYRWAVYSPTDSTARAVTGGWIDNAWDIQRRRGLDLTDRQTFGTGRT